MTIIPTLEQCHETAGNLIALQSRRLVELANFKAAIRSILVAKDQHGVDLPDDMKLGMMRKAMKECP